MKKSYLSGCLVLGLVFSALVGCGDDDDSTNGSSGGHGGAQAHGGNNSARGGGGGGTARGGGTGNGGLSGVAGASGSAGTSSVTGGRSGGGGVTGAGGVTSSRGGSTGAGARGGSTGTGARGGTTGGGGEAGALAGGGGAAGSGEAGQAGNAGAGGAESARVQSLSDAQIFLLLEDLNAGEVQQANTALPKLTVTDVSAFAQAMVADHTQARDEVQALAQSLSVTPSESEVDAKLRWKSAVVVDKLTAGTSPLDMMYMNSQVKAHADALKLLDGLQPDAAQLVQLIGTLRTAVQAHYDVAVTIRASL